MRKRRLLQSVLITALCLLTLIIMPTAQAAIDLADGTYTLNYTITKAENESVSMANDYFEKPATVFVKNGQIEIQLPINHSKWVTQFKIPNQASLVDAKVISTDTAADKRIVRFPVSDLSKPIISKIHVTVPSIDYDHDYTIRFMLDEKSIKSTEAVAAAPAKAATETPATPPAALEAAPAPSSSSDKATVAVAPTPASASAETKPAPKPVATTTVEATKTASAAAAVGAPVAANGNGNQAVANASTVANPKTGDSASIAIWVTLLPLALISLGYMARTRRTGKVIK
ncbi:heme uptake protein IsdC [Paenibacillus agricola]|uniref:Heme uptake protein IsdC n=1 Tax=Paenibacillus agricola TaxID=2716264 RepID=A0ABX0J5T1_9BACL|nr:heme uptake protein IsdC [Paenibacillus agricola]NHN29175.1 heme uptake protein IsdC [Paenibacillus agricola]